MTEQPKDGGPPMTDPNLTAPEAVARMLEGVTPTAWKYRWKIDGEYVQWRYSDASNFHRSLDGFEEVPLYSADMMEALAAERDALIHDLARLKDSETHQLNRAEALAARVAENAKLREALTEAVEVVHKAYVAATMEAVNAGPSHPLKDNFDKWRVRCMNAETTARAALQGETT
jgi:hypothetical protein